MTRNRRPWMIEIAAILGVLFLAKTASWISSGCPLGFTSGSCVTSMIGRTITATSDHLLGGVTLTADREMAVIDLGIRRVVVRGNEATIDGSTKVVIPAGCKDIDLAVRGDTLEIKADGTAIRPAH